MRYFKADSNIKRQYFVTAAILLAVLIFTIGFWRTLLLTAITALCYFVGCILDKGGKEGLQEALSRLFRKN